MRNPRSAANAAIGVMPSASSRWAARGFEERVVVGHRIAPEKNKNGRLFFS